MRCVHLTMTLNTILYKIFPVGYLECSRLLIATIEFTIFKNSKKNIVNSIEVLLIIFWVLHIGA